MQINIHESDPRLSQLVQRVIAGEEIIISSEAGEPVAKLVSYAKKQKTPRTLGGWEGKGLSRNKVHVSCRSHRMFSDF